MKKIRTLGFYQPFATLMKHGKIETRWVRKGKKPPFPLGQYVFYSTLIPCSNADLFNWCGPEIIQQITNEVQFDDSKRLNGFAIATGELVEVRLFTKDDEPKAFVKYVGEKDLAGHTKVQWALVFKDVKEFTPFLLKGKQGIGFLPDSLIQNLHQ